MSRRGTRAWAALSTRLAVGAGLGVGVAVAVGAGIATPWPTLEQQPATVAVTPTPDDTVLACPGPILALGRDAADAAGLTSAAAGDVVAGSDGSEPEITELVTNPTAEGSDGAPVVTASPEGDRRSAAAAAASASIDADDLRGLAASDCRPALIESWLVGGATTTGAADLILLSNPSDVPATVQLTLYAATGASTPPGGADLVVDARGQRIVPLAALGVGEEAPIVRVTAAGAPVAAALQTSITRTLLPGGVDQTGAVAGAQTTQLIPGVLVPESAVEAAEAGATTRLRLLSAGVAAAATVTARDDDGAEVLSREVELEADLPLEVDLTGLPAGRHTVVVEAEAPVLAALWQTTGFGDDADFAWHLPASRIDAPTLVAVPEGPGSTVTLADVSGVAAVATLEPLSGPGQAVTETVPADGATTLAVVPGTVYRLDVDGAVHATVGYAGTGALAAFPIWPADAAAPEIVVHP